MGQDDAKLFDKRWMYASKHLISSGFYVILQLGPLALCVVGFVCFVSPSEYAFAALVAVLLSSAAASGSTASAITRNLPPSKSCWQALAPR
jgi:hypothetical protein